MNALLQIPELQRKRGVVAFSSGNHAQGVALASKLLGVRATIVMPEGSVATKVEATKAYGAEVVTSGVTAATRDTVAREIAEKTGASVIPPFDDERIIAGQGTVGLEILEEWPQVETIVVPLGGGGLLSGIAVAATSVKPNIAVYGVEPRAGNDGEVRDVSDQTRDRADRSAGNCGATDTDDCREGTDGCRRVRREPGLLVALQMKYEVRSSNEEVRTQTSILRSAFELRTSNFFSL